MDEKKTVKIKRKSKASRTKVTVVILILILLGIVYFVYLDHKNPKSEDSKEGQVSVMTKVLSKNLDEDYFQTPREVVEYYSEIMYCYYSEEYSEEQFKMLTEQARKCMDSELLEGNPYEEYYTNLKAEIQAYKEEEKTLSTYIVDDFSQVKKFKNGGKSYARLKCTYYMKGKKDTTKSRQEYTLRQDEEGRWKILYWNLSNDDE